MKRIFATTLACVALMQTSFATDTQFCSNFDQTVTFSKMRYAGGPPPPPGTPIMIFELVKNGATLRKETRFERMPEQIEGNCEYEIKDEQVISKTSSGGGAVTITHSWIRLQFCKNDPQPQEHFLICQHTLMLRP